jgi:polysaccharide biosynthesis protein PslH
MSDNASIRTLVLTTKLPYPPVGGAALRNWQNINAMLQYGEVGLFYVYTEQEQPDEIPAHIPGIKEWYHCLVQEPSSFMEKMKWRLNILQWLLFNTEKFSSLYYSVEAADKLDYVMRTFQPDLVVFEEIWLYCYFHIVKQYPCKVVFDNHNAETLLFQGLMQKMKIESLNNKIYIQLLYKIVEKSERDFVQKANQVWVCSDEDAQIIQKLAPRTSPTFVIPNGINVNHYQAKPETDITSQTGLKEEPFTLVFTASFNYPPNAEAAEFLLQEIFPKLQAIHPNCRLLLVGVNPKDFMLEAAQQNPQIIVTGKVADIRPYVLSASVVIVPLLEGSGTRLKILEAFAAGRPVVSTSKGAEGLQAQDNVHLLIRDDVDGLVEGVSRIWQDPQFSQALVDNAFELVQAQYSWEAAGQKISTAVEQLFPRSFKVSEPVKSP